MNMNTSRGKTNTLMVLLLFAIFAACILSVLLTGTDVYRRIAARDAESYGSRTAEQYLAMRVRQGDVQNSLRLATFGDADALVFTEEIDGKSYKTLVYCANGYLRELFTADLSGFAPGDGEEILPAQSLHFSLDGRHLTATLVDEDGEPHELTLLLRSGGEAGA